MVLGVSELSYSWQSINRIDSLHLDSCTRASWRNNTESQAPLDILIFNSEIRDFIRSSCGSAWRRKWQPTPVLLPREFCGQRSLVGCCPWVAQSRTWLKWLSSSSSGSAGKESACTAGDLGSIPGLRRCPGEGKGYPLQYSGLENPRDCIVHGVAESDTTERLALSLGLKAIHAATSVAGLTILREVSSDAENGWTWVLSTQLQKDRRSLLL